MNLGKKVKRNNRKKIQKNNLSLCENQPWETKLVLYIDYW
jgi:hypothetical protein